MPKPAQLLHRLLAGIVAIIATTASAVPAITQHPAPTVIATSGQPATFSAQATGIGTLRWQWRRVGVALAGQTSASIALPAATMADTGFYDVVVTDDTGSTTSAPSRLMITPAGGYRNTFRLDTNFRPTFETDGANITGIAIASDGKVYVSGDFVGIAGMNRTSVARFSENLAPDPTFNPSVVSSCNAIATQPDGRLLVAANVRRPDGTTTGPIVRLLPDGTIDPSFTAPAFFPSNTPAYLRITALQPDGKLLVAGSFTAVGDLPRAGIVRLNSDGSVDPSFNANLGTNSSISRIALSAGKVILLGTFRPPSGPVRELVRLNGDGSEDTTFAPQLSSLYGPFAVDASGRLYVNGRTSYATPTRMVRLLNDGSIDPSFQTAPQTLTPQTATPLADGRIAAIWSADGDVPTFGILSEAGSVLTSNPLNNGVPTRLPNRITTTDGKIYVIGDGTYSPFIGGAARFSTDATVVSSIPAGLRSVATPEVVRPAPGGKWIVGGPFSRANGIPSQGIARLNPDGTTDTSFTADNPGFSVTDLAVQGDGMILAMGIYPPFARRFLANGRQDPSFPLVVASSLTSAKRFLALPDGRYAAMGWISSYAGEYVNAGLILLQPNGVRDTSSVPIIRPNGSDGNTVIEAVGGGYVAAGGLSTDMGMNAIFWFDGRGNLVFPSSLDYYDEPAGITFDAAGRLVAIRSGSVSRIDQQGTVLSTTSVPTLSPRFLLAGLLPQTDNKILVEASARPSMSPVAYGPVLRLNADDSLDTAFQVPDLRNTFSYFSHTTAQYADDGRLLVCGAYAVRGDEEQFGLALFKPEALPPAPVITRQPASLNATVGGNATFEFEATGDISYFRWRKGGSPLVTTTTPKLCLAGLTADSYDVYTVEVVGPGGIASSKPFLLGITAVAGPRYRLLDFFNPLVAGNEWRYTRDDSAPERTQARTLIADLERTITTYTDGAAATPVPARVIAVSNDRGATTGSGFVAAESWTDYFASDGLSLGFHGNDVPGPQTNRFAGAFRFPATMAVGEAAVSMSDTYVNGTWTGPTAFAFRLIGVESVSTPAGTFNACLRIRFSTADDGLWTYEEQWWARGVGIVKTYRTKDRVTQLLETCTVQSPILPAISSGPADTSIPAGSSASLAVIATGTSPLFYQWYQGESGDTTRPLAGSTNATMGTPTLTEPTKFWVRVANRSATANSPAATVSITNTGISFAAWIAASNAPEDQRGALDTPAHDGVANLLKFALGVPPLADARAHLPVPSLHSTGGQPAVLALVFARNPTAQGIRCVLETSTDLVTWTEAACTTDLLGTNPDGTELLRLREIAPATGDRRFARLKVITTGP